MSQFVTKAEKVRAQQRVGRAVASGALIRPALCSECSAPQPDAHHEDYAKPLDVVWLCRRCHFARHRDLRQRGLAPAYSVLPVRRMTPEEERVRDELHQVEAAYKTASARMTEARDERDRLVKEAVAAGWTLARVAEATGLTRGRVNQIVRGRR